MLTIEERKTIFKRKRQRIERKKNKKGDIKERIISGFLNTTFEEFEIWYSDEVFNKGCKYCGLTNERSMEIYEFQRKGLRHDATRGGKRGRRLELDRRDPNLSYDNLENIVWCCYWCNNAKSNFFTIEEFEPIATAIGKVLKEIQ